MSDLNECSGLGAVCWRVRAGLSDGVTGPRVVCPSPRSSRLVSIDLEVEPLIDPLLCCNGAVVDFRGLN